MTAGPGELSALAVDLRGRRIGLIHRLAGDKQVFSFEQDYIDDSGRPTLSLSFKSRTGGLITTIHPVQRRVPPFFSNLLPEGHLREYLAERAGVNPEREFFLLAALGEDLAGAVTATPFDRGEQERPEVRERGAGPGGVRDGSGVLRFSLAGVQLKFSAVMEAAGGLTIPAHGVGGGWIVKLPSARFDAVSENEFLMLELARAAGIATPRTRLVPLDSIGRLPAGVAAVRGSALTVERFDRGPGRERIHMEDFAQVFGIFPENKYMSVSYANIARVLWAETGEAGAYEFVRRLVFSVLIGNADMHLKNWSLLYPDGRTPVLAPAYDFVATLPYIPGDKLALSFGGSRAFDAVTFDELRRFAEKAGLPMTPVVRVAKETAEATLAAWTKLGQKEILPSAILESIDKQIGRAAKRTLEELARQPRG